MKKIYILLLSGFFLTPLTYAQEGNATANTYVQTYIEGSGSVTTHIESTVNGETKILDANTPGIYTLELATTSTPTPQTTTLPKIITPTAHITPMPSALPTPHKKILQVHPITIFDKIKNFLKAFFSGLSL